MPSRTCQLRQERGLAATQLARLLQVSEWAVRSWEMGRTAPTRRHERALAKALGVTGQKLGVNGSSEAGE